MSRFNNIRCFVRAACLALVAAVFVSSAAAEEQRWDYLPYRVQVLTCVAPECRFAAGFDDELRGSLASQAESQIGGAWNLKCTPAPAPLAAELLADFAHVTADKLLAAAGKEVDKVFVVAVDPARVGHRVRVREFDVTTGTLGPIVERVARQPSTLFSTAAAALFTSFSPLAHVQMPREGEVVLRVRASRLAPEKSPAAALPKSLFRPFVPAKKGEGDTASALAPIPWTYVEVKGPAGGNLAGRLISGAAEALPVKSQQERLAIMVKPIGESTTLKFIAAESDEKQPLAGYELSERTDDGALVPLGETSAQGTLVIAANEHPLRDVYVTSGKATLARLPLVPGYLSEETVVLADDGPRREAEGYLRTFEGRLLDVLAQRAELVARAKRRLADGKRGEAEAVARQLRKLPSKELLSTDLEQARRRITSTTKGTLTVQVDAMFQSARQQLEAHLGPNPLAELPGLGAGAP